MLTVGQSRTGLRIARMPTRERTNYRNIQVLLASDYIRTARDSDADPDVRRMRQLRRNPVHEDVPRSFRRSVGHCHYQERAKPRLAVLPVLANSSSGRHRLLVIRTGSPIIFRSINRPNNCVQATPDYACCEFLRQGAGAPDAER